MNYTEWMRRSWRSMGCMIVAGLALLGANSAARAQDNGGNSIPGGVLLFPVAVVDGDGKPVTEETATTRLVRTEATEALRKYLHRNGIGVFVYSKRLPSIQRAVAEGTINEKIASAGPQDDERTAQRLAEIAGTSEYLSATTEGYKYDSATRTATLSISVFRRSAADGGPLGTSAAQTQGTAPADVATPRQEGSAAARAADAAAEQVIQSLYPRPAMMETPEKPTKKAPRKSQTERYILPAFGALLGILILTD